MVLTNPAKAPFQTPSIKLSCSLPLSCLQNSQEEKTTALTMGTVMSGQQIPLKRLIRPSCLSMFFNYCTILAEGLFCILTFSVSKTYPDRQFPTPDKVPQIRSSTNLSSITTKYYLQQQIHTNNKILPILNIIYIYIDVITIDYFIVMNSSVLTYLKSLKQATNLSIEDVIFIGNNNQLSLVQARRYVLDNYPSLDVDWRGFQNQELARIVKQGNNYKNDNVQKWKLQQDVYKRNQFIIQEDPQHRALPKLNQKLANLKQLLSNETQPQNVAEIEKESQQIEKCIEAHRLIAEHEAKQSAYHKQQDSQRQQMLAKIMAQLSQYQSKEKLSKTNELKTEMEGKLEGLTREQGVMKRRLMQIFYHYAKENNHYNTTFEDSGKYAQSLDLRLFLKYYKDFKLHETSQEHMKISTVTLHYKNHSHNGLWLNAFNFWAIHKKIFKLTPHEITRREIIESEYQKLLQIKASLDTDIASMKQMSEVITQQKTIKKLHLLNMKTEVSPERKEVPPTAQLSSIRSTSNIHSSKYGSAFNLSPPKKLSPTRKSHNFIQQVRQELMNGEESPISLEIPKNRSNLLAPISPQKKTIDLNLPKLLKIKEEDLKTQGIYKSLKHYPKYEFYEQQKKFKDILKLSEKDDEEFMSRYFENEHLRKQADEQCHLEKRQQLKNSKVVEKHCRKLRLKEIEPYMRF